METLEKVYLFRTEQAALGFIEAMEAVWRRSKTVYVKSSCGPQPDGRWRVIVADEEPDPQFNLFAGNTDGERTERTEK